VALSDLYLVGLWSHEFLRALGVVLERPVKTTEFCATSFFSSNTIRVFSSSVLIISSAACTIDSMLLSAACSFATTMSSTAVSVQIF